MLAAQQRYAVNFRASKFEKPREGSVLATIATRVVLFRCRTFKE